MYSVKLIAMFPCLGKSLVTRTQAIINQMSNMNILYVDADSGIFKDLHPGLTNSEYATHLHQLYLNPERIRLYPEYLHDVKLQNDFTAYDSIIIYCSVNDSVLSLLESVAPHSAIYAPHKDSYKVYLSRLKHRFDTSKLSSDERAYRYMRDNFDSAVEAALSIKTEKYQVICK